MSKRKLIWCLVAMVACASLLFASLVSASGAEESQADEVVQEEVVVDEASPEAEAESLEELFERTFENFDREEFIRGQGRFSLDLSRLGIADMAAVDALLERFGHSNIDRSLASFLENMDWNEVEAILARFEARDDLQSILDRFLESVDPGDLEALLESHGNRLFDMADIVVLQADLNYQALRDLLADTDLAALRTWLDSLNVDEIIDWLNNVDETQLDAWFQNVQGSEIEAWLLGHDLSEPEAWLGDFDWDAFADWVNGINFAAIRQRLEARDWESKAQDVANRFGGYDEICVHIDAVDWVGFQVRAIEILGDVDFDAVRDAYSTLFNSVDLSGINFSRIIEEIYSEDLHERIRRFTLR